MLGSVLPAAAPSGSGAGQGLTSAEEKRQPVAIGDVVLLFSEDDDEMCIAPTKRGDLLAVRSMKKKQHSQDALFEILPRTNYRTDAPPRGQSRSLRSSRRSLEEIKSDEQVRREQQLEEAAGREYKNKTPLTYGQTIQLRHIATQKFLARHFIQVVAGTGASPSLRVPQLRRPKTTGRQATGTYIIALDNGSKNCWFTVWPRNGPKKAGKNVLAGESIVLVSHVSAVHEGFIHQSSASTPDGTGFQLQLSSEKNKIGWKMAVQDSKIMKKKTLLESGRKFRLYYQDDSAEGSVSMKGYVVGNIASKGMDPHRVHLESYWRAAKVPDTYHSIFEVEILDDEKTISWDKTRCRFKLFTPYPEAMYLSMGPAVTDANDFSGLSASSAPLSTSDSGLQNSNLFAQSRLASEATAILSPQPTAETVFTLKAGSKQDRRNQVRLGSSVQLHSEAGDRWLHCRPSLFDLDDASLQLRHHLKYQEILLSAKLRTSDVFVLRPVPNREVAAISDVERAVTEIDLFLKEFDELYNNKKRDKILGLLKEEADTKLSPGLRNIKDVLQRLRTFCTGGSPGSSSVYSYCKLIGDNMIIDRFFNILKRFTRMESNRFNPWRLRQIDHNGVKELHPAYPFVYTICHLVYHLLRLAASASHQAAALLISDKNYQYILRQQLNKEINKPIVTTGSYKGKLGLVSRTLSKVFDSNPRLLSKASTEAEGDVLQMIFLLCDALKEFDYSSTAHLEAGFNHLSVLAKLCEENGVAVPAYQNAIVNALRIGRKDSAYSMFLPSKVSDDGKLLICLRPEEAEENAKESGAWYDLTSSAFSNARYGYIYHYYAAMTNLFASLCIGRNYNSMRLLLRDNLLLNSQHTAKILTSVAGFSPSSLLAMYWRTMLHTFVDKYPLTSLRPTKIWAPLLGQKKLASELSRRRYTALLSEGDRASLIALYGAIRSQLRSIADPLHYVEYPDKELLFEAIKMLRFLISFRLVGENDFLYPTSFKRYYFRHLDNTPSGEEDLRFIHQGDLRADDSVDDPTHPLLGYLLTILRCRREQLASSAEEVLLQETKKEICQILDLMFDVATNTRVLELLRAVQTKFADTHPVAHEQPRFAFLGKNQNTPQLDVGALHKMASQCLEEDPRSFRKQAKMAYKLALRHELMWSLGEIGDDDRPRALGFLPATARISIDIRRGGGQPAADTSHPRAKPNKAADGRLSIFNVNEQGIDLDAVMVSLISENDPHFISAALHLTRRNRSHIDEVWNGINNLQVLVEEPSWQAYLVIRKQTKLLRAQQADPAFLTRPHADESILALAALLDPATLDSDQVHVNQKLVRNMFVHEEVLNILKRPWELSKDQPIISACCLLLKRLCANNSACQTALLAHVEVLLSRQLWHCSAVEDVAGVVQAIFLDNRLLASKANVPLLQRLVSFLELESEDAPLVMPTSFTSFSLPGDEGDRGEGQHTTSTEGGDVAGAGASSTEGRDSTLRDDSRRIRLTKAVVSTLERLIYPIDGMEPMASTQSLVVKLIENKTRGLGLHSATAIAKNIHHNTQVVRLLAVCADQKNFVAESACQKILSFHACLSIANMPNVPNTTKAAYLHFLDEVYLNTEVDTYEILEEQRPLWFPSLLDFLTKAVQELRQFVLAMQERLQAQQQLKRQKQREKARRKSYRKGTGVRRKNKKGGKKKKKPKKGKRGDDDDVKGKQKDSDGQEEDDEEQDFDYDDEYDCDEERGTVKKARKACKIAEEAVEDDSGYMFRILLPFLSNLFGGPFNPLELPTAQADSQGLDQSMSMASSPIPTIKITPVVTVTNTEDHHVPQAKPYDVNVDNQRARLVAKDILETAAHLSQLLDGLLAMPGKKQNNTTADNNLSALDLLGLDHVCRLIDILHRHDVRTDDSANAELEEEAARLNHDLEGMDVDLVDEDLGRTVMLKSGMHATVFSVDEEEADVETSATKKLSLSNRLTRYHDQFLSSVNMREQAVRPKGQQQDSSSSDSSPLGGRREADRITPRYEQMELGESQEALVRPRSLWSRFWRLTPQRGRPRVTFADDEASGHGRADAHGTIDDAPTMPLSVLSRENASNSARLFMRHLDQLEAALRHKERDVWKDMATLPGMSRYATKRVFIRQLDIRESSGFSQHMVTELHVSCLRIMRKFHLRWDSEDRNLIKEAIIYTFPLFQSDSPQVVYEASKFMVALINANRTNKSIHQRIDDCRAWRSSGQSYKGEDSIRAFMLSVYTSSASTFFADIKNLIERSIKQMERIRHSLNTTGDLLASYDPAPIQAVFELLQQLCSRDDIFENDEPYEEKVRIKLRLEDPQLYEDLVYSEQINLQNRDLEQKQIQQYMRSQRTDDEQPNGSSRECYNMIWLAVKYLRKIRHVLMYQNAALVSQVLHTLISFTEGSEENIEFLIKQANIADVANPLMQLSYFNEVQTLSTLKLAQEQIKVITTALLELLLGLVEGNPNADTVLFLASKLDFEKMTSSSSKGQLGALLGQAKPGSDPHRSTDSRLRRSTGRGRSSSSDSESDGEEPDANPGSEQASGHFYVFDEWLASNSDDKAVDIFSEEARLPILFFMLIRILTQADESERYRRISRILFPPRANTSHLADTATRSKNFPIQIGHIEVVTDAQDSKKSAGAIQSVYFPLPAVCAQHCSDYDRCSNDFALLQGAFVSNAVEQTWESASERISTFVSWCEKVLIEMEYEQLRGKHTGRDTQARTGMSWLLSNNRYVSWFTYILAIVINILILVGYGHSDYRAPEVKWVTISLMILHVASAGLILLVLFYTRAPSANAKRWADYLSTWSHLGVVQSMIGATGGNRTSRPRQQNMLKIKADRKKAIIAQLQQSRATGFSWLLRMRWVAHVRYWLWTGWHIATDLPLLYHMIYFVTSLLGTVHFPYWFVCTLFFILVWSSPLRTILRVIRMTAWRLFLMALLILPVVYVFSIFGYLFLSKYYPPENNAYCDTVLQCMVCNMQMGLPLQGGLIQVLPNAPITDSWWEIFGWAIYLLGFWVVVGMFLLNICLAIIVDTFGMLRDRESDFRSWIASNCFICSVARDRFQSLGGRSMFARHISGEHDLWHYLYFFAFLKYKRDAIKRQRKARRAHDLGHLREDDDGLLRFGPDDDNDDAAAAAMSSANGRRSLLRFTHVQREIFKKINSGTEEDILSIFPIERSQAMEEFEKQIEANKAEHDPIVEIHKLKKKIKDNHQLLKQVMQQLNGNSTFGQTSGIARAALGASTLSIPSWRHDV